MIEWIFRLIKFQVRFSSSALCGKILRQSFTLPAADNFTHSTFHDHSFETFAHQLLEIKVNPV